MLTEFVNANDKVGQHCNEKNGTNDEWTSDSVIMAGITLANHGDARLIEEIAVYQDANTEGGIHVGKSACDGITRGIEKGDGECSDKDGSIEPRKPCSFVGKPDFCLYLDGGGDLARHANVWGKRLD